jgi:hypothetical protein
VAHLAGILRESAVSAEIEGRVRGTRPRGGIPLLGPEGRILRVTGSSRDGGEFPLIRTLTRDTRSVFGETRRQGFRRAGARTLEDLEAFYLSEERRQRLAGMGRLRRWLHRGAWLLRASF